jgi:hypothetical protein
LRLRLISHEKEGWMAKELIMWPNGDAEVFDTEELERELQFLDIKRWLKAAIAALG